MQCNFFPLRYNEVSYTQFGDHSLWKWEAIKDFNQGRSEMKLVCYENYYLVVEVEWISNSQISIGWIGGIIDERENKESN